MNRLLFYSILKFELTVLTKTKSFWLISLIPPLALIVMFVVNYNSGHVDSVLVNNQSHLISPIEPTTTLQVKYGTDNGWQEKGYDAYICINQACDSVVTCRIYSTYVLHPTTQQAIRNDLEKNMAEAHLGVNLAKVKAQEGKKIRMETHIENPRYKLMGISMASVFLTYLIVLQFASAILRMSGREKVNKISEILLSAMSPKIIMGGKLAACLLAAFLQLAVWCAVAIAAILLALNIPTFNIDHRAIEALLQTFTSIPIGQMAEFVVIYLLYLVGGFLLYCILFSILGAISNENTNTQQFSLVVTIPLLVTFVYVIKDFGSGSQWLTRLSYFPMSSPIAAIPIVAKHGITCQIIVSLLILAATIAILFHFACILYSKGTLASKNKVTLRTIINWLSK